MMPSAVGQNFGPNWAVLILRNLEETVLFDTAATSINAYMDTPAEAAWRSIRAANLSAYRCPSGARRRPMLVERSPTPEPTFSGLPHRRYS